MRTLVTGGVAMAVVAVAATTIRELMAASGRGRSILGHPRLLIRFHKVRCGRVGVLHPSKIQNRSRSTNRDSLRESAALPMVHERDLSHALSALCAICYVTGARIYCEVAFDVRSVCKSRRPLGGKKSFTGSACSLSCTGFLCFGGGGRLDDAGHSLLQRCWSALSAPWLGP